MDDNKNSKKNCCFRYRWLILILTLFLTLAVTLIIIFIIRTKLNSQPVLVNALNASITGVKYDVSYEEYVLLEYNKYFILQ